MNFEKIPTQENAQEKNKAEESHNGMEQWVKNFEERSKPLK